METELSQKCLHYNVLGKMFMKSIDYSYNYEESELSQFQTTLIASTIDFNSKCKPY